MKINTVSSLYWGFPEKQKQQNMDREKDRQQIDD